MSKKRRGLSIGSIIMLLITLLVVAGSLAFFVLAGRDSPAASMSLSELVDAVGSALMTPLPAAETAAPKEPEPLEVTPSPSPTAAPKPLTLSLSIGGLIQFESDIVRSGSFENGGGEILEHLKPYFSSDVNIAGFDQIISDDPKRGDDLRVSPAALDLIRQTGVDTLLMPLGRLYDDGMDGASASITAIKARSMRPLGPAIGAQQSLRVNGINIGWLHLTDQLSRAGGRALKEAPGHALDLDINMAGEWLRGLKEKHDLLIVSVNWPLGRGGAPSDKQRETARSLAELGADIVIGFGGDQVQGVERLTVGDREALVAYSMGTLLSENRRRMDLQAGMVLQLALSRMEGQRWRFDAVRYSPTYVHKWSAERRDRFSVIPSTLPYPEGLSKAQRDALSKAFQLIEKAMQDSTAQLYR